MRSAPPLADWMKFEPSSTIAAHCEAAASDPSAAASAAAACCPAAASASSASPHSAASASWLIWALCNMALGRARHDFMGSWVKWSLDDDLLGQHRIDPARRDRQIDSAGQFFLEAVKSGRAVEVGRPQLAQISLEGVEHARHRCLDLRRERRVGDFEDDFDLEILRAIAAGTGEVDQHLGHVDEDHGFRRHGGGLGFLDAAEHEIGRGPATAEHSYRDSGDDDELEREFAFRWDGGVFAFLIRLAGSLASCLFDLRPFRFRCHSLVPSVGAGEWASGETPTNQRPAHEGTLGWEWLMDHFDPRLARKVLPSEWLRWNEFAVLRTLGNSSK